MPILKWFPPQGSPRTFAIYKPVSTVGRALGNDVAIPTGGISDTHAQVLFDGRDFNLHQHLSASRNLDHAARVRDAVCPLEEHKRLESGIEGVVVPLPERDDVARPSDNAAVA